MVYWKDSKTSTIMKKKKKILIVGCGPKALALCTKAHVLAALGWAVPEIIVIEKNEIGAHWSGQHGYTDGKNVLGISPMKDLGYPYDSSFGKKADEAMEAFSFISFLKETDEFTAWVDGWTQQITHRDLYSYLNWAAKKLGLVPIRGEVTALTPNGDGWIVNYTDSSGIEKTIECDAVIATGPGGVRKTIEIPESKNMFDAKNFWIEHENILTAKDQRIALIGGGISAGSILEKLLPAFPESSHIDWYTRRGIFTRSENFVNNQLFTYPDEWPELSEKVREQFIQHTDRGSIDPTTHLVMARHHKQFSMVLGEPDRVTEDPNGRLRVRYTNNKGTFEHLYDKVIMATGFDNVSFLNWLPESFKNEHSLVYSEIAVAKRLNTDLSLIGLKQKLHLPMLAWHDHGIGLSILSCLSILSDKILASYVTK